MYLHTFVIHISCLCISNIIKGSIYYKMSVLCVKEKFVLYVHIILYLCACSVGRQGFIQMWHLKVDEITNITQTQPLCTSHTVTYKIKRLWL